MYSAVAFLFLRSCLRIRPCGFRLVIVFSDSLPRLSFVKPFFLTVQTQPCSRTHLLTDVPGNRVVAGELFAADDVPDAREPVCEQSEDGHEEREHHGAVLRVTVHLLQQTQQTQQTHGLQQVH